jgi:hypothetical protein
MAALPDCLMMAEVKDFADWHQGFKAHATETTFTMNGGTSYTVSIPREHTPPFCQSLSAQLVPCSMSPSV